MQPDGRHRQPGEAGAEQPGDVVELLGRAEPPQPGHWHRWLGLFLGLLSLLAALSALRRLRLGVSLRSRLVAAAHRQLGGRDDLHDALRVERRARLHPTSLHRTLGPLLRGLAASAALPAPSLLALRERGSSGACSAASWYCTSARYTPASFSMSSVCVPCSTTRPSSITAILSALRMVESRCAITSVVRPPAASSSSSAACTMAPLSLSSAEVASSRTRMAGSRTRARAMASRCFCPPESCTPFSPTSVAYWSGKLATKPAALDSVAAASTSFCVAPSRPIEMFQ